MQEWFDCKVKYLKGVQNLTYFLINNNDGKRFNNN